ncbi:DUF6708 domain-containing protein [Burkholderia stagnalis]|uniref:DUF6708 domain-containing protein n=1 Tax=Burkholderia stagnalis TaxID=1503054 RepID=UPI000B24EFAC|nr:DUF6708 domain-containing protein [Burkholderia stagnalis]
MVTTLKKERPISAQDIEWHLSISKRVAEPHASAMVIRLNSTYLELVDGVYSNRGAMSQIGLIFIFAMLSMLVSDFAGNSPWWNLLISAVFSGLMVSFALFCMWKIGEWFGFTHYPIRLNRINRTVYVFRRDGTILSARWDDLYFALRVNSRAAGFCTVGICGLVLKDSKTVEEMFVFGYASTSRENCLRHWEFIRRYMEEGPRAVLNVPGLGLYLPIADKRETLYEGWIELVSNDAWNPVFKWLMFPFHVLFFIGRLVNRVTSKVPMWPADVEAACRIEPGDPYVRDSSLNPPGYR